MAKVSVITPDKVRPASSGDGVKTYLDGDSPLHLHLHQLTKGRGLQIDRSAIDQVVYVWRGAVTTGEQRLAEGSSIVVEHGRALAMNANVDSQVLIFSASDTSSQSRAGGHVHVLPTERVPRTPNDGVNVSGGMHANSECPTCEVWLHENTFPGKASATSEDEERGVHSHTENEIIFVTDGQIRLGNRLCGPGTALAIAANTLYSFTPGPEGLRFINFRASRPGDIRFANGTSMSETGYWRERVASPQYVDVSAG